MNKSPEEYFQDQILAPAAPVLGAGFSEAELAFMRKYMGLDAQETLEQLGIKAEVPLGRDSAPQARPAEQPSAPAPLPAPEGAASAPPEAEAGRASEESLVPAGAPETGLTETVAAVEPESAAVEAEAAAPAESAAPETVAVTEPEPAFTDAVAAVSAGEPEPVLIEAVASTEPEPALPEAAAPAESAVAETVAVAEPDPAAVEAEAAAPAESAAPETVAVTEPEPAFTDAVAAVSAGEPEPVLIEAVASTEPEPALPEAAAPAESAIAEPEPAAAEAPVAEAAPEAAAAQSTPDHAELETFQETVGQQFLIIRAALDGLRQNGTETDLSDALYRSLITVQNSAAYMGLDDVRVYAERTAGIVDQGRKTGLDFSVLVDLLGQEAAILEDMVQKALSAVTAPAPESASPADIPAASAPEAPSPAAAPETAVAELSNTAAEPASRPAADPDTASATAPTETPVYAEPPADVHAEMSEEESLDAILRRESEIQMVGFYIGKQEFTVPTLAVQEVIRYEVPARMPAAPSYVAGVINLRGKMTPLVHLRDMLEIRQPRGSEDRFIIVCRRKGLQIGLIIERVHTMYRVPQADIDWGIESLLGINNAEFISGLLKLGDFLVGVVSVDRIIDYVLE